MKSGTVRQTFLDFFKSKNHNIVKSAPMLIKDDPSLMFTNAGMNQFKDIFLDLKKPEHNRVANSQKCLRVSGKHNDIEDVGHDTYHHTMFEMLGNWSFLDYFKKEAISYAWELLTEVYKIDKDRLYVTVFGGDKQDNLKTDTEAENIWSEYIDKSRILYGSKKDNFWEMGETGPCGPCSEIHVDIRDTEEIEKLPGKELVNKDHPLVVEIWNLVFIQYNRKADASLEMLPNKHVDTGMGFERLCMVLQNKKSNYDTDVFQKLLDDVGNMANIKYGTDEKADIAMRVIVDHLRTLCFSIADGQLPSNVKAGYVIRRILRRAIRYGYSFLNFKSPFMYNLVPSLIEIMGDAYPELEAQKDIIEKVCKEEEKVFLKTLDKGLKLIDKKISQLKNDKSEVISGKDAFELYDTYGFPLDLTELIAKENNMRIDANQFKEEMEKQKNRARNDASITSEDWSIVREAEQYEFVGYDTTQADVLITKYRKVKHKSKSIYHIVLNKSPFYAEAGGQVGDSGYIESENEKIFINNTITEHGNTIHIAEKLPNDLNAKFIAVVNKDRRDNIAKNHSATHLLHKSLIKKLGKHVEQKGSLVDENRLRFDFSHFNKMSEEEIRGIEKEINSLIRKNVEVSDHRNLEFDAAKKMGAISLFGEKYGDKVRVVKMDDAIELCGGTHVRYTGEIGFFKIISESAIAAGIRRIEALTAYKAEELIYSKFDELKNIKEVLENPKDVIKAVKNIADNNKELTKKVEEFKKSENLKTKRQLIEQAEQILEVKLINNIVEVDSANDLKEISSQIRGELDQFVCLLGADIKGKPNMLISISEDIAKEKNINAGKIIKDAAKLIKGGGGGQPYLATAGGSDVSKLKEALKYAEEEIKNLLA